MGFQWNFNGIWIGFNQQNIDFTNEYWRWVRLKQIQKGDTSKWGLQWGKWWFFIFECLPSPLCLGCMASTVSELWTQWLYRVGPWRVRSTRKKHVLFVYICLNIRYQTSSRHKSPQQKVSTGRLDGGRAELSRQRFGQRQRGSWHGFIWKKRGSFQIPWLKNLIESL